MNSDLESFPESLQRSLLAWLLHPPRSTPSFDQDGFSSNPSGLQFQPAALPDSRESSLVLDPLDPLDSEAVDILLTDSSFAERFSSLSGNQSRTSGDTPTVQDRFHALLKRQLQIEIQQHPPRFPWETGSHDYEYETVSSDSPTESASSPLWAAHLQQLSLPVSIPESVLTQLLDRCQAVLQLSLREGAKLVQAVEELFPGQSPALNHLAGLVLASPSRSGTTLNQPKVQPTLAYETAKPAQQMVVSLLAAREILRSLTLMVSPAQPTVSQEWLTACGKLTLDAHYTAQEPTRLRVMGYLPAGGSLTLQQGEVQAYTARPEPGHVSVEVFNPQVDQLYVLQVQLRGQEDLPLRFTVCLTADLGVAA